VSVRRASRLPLEDLRPYLLELPRFPSRATDEGGPPLVPLDWPTIFGNDHPVELEVGFGKGLFLLTAAQAAPTVSFVGVEIVRKYQLFTATRLAKRALSNVRLACADARLFLRDGVKADSLQTLHVYFPDPWWKQRHHKRRVFTSEFVEQAVRILRPGGQLSVATDVEEYATIIRSLVATQPALKPREPAEPDAPVHDLDYLTNFERKFRKEGRPIYRLLYRKADPLHFRAGHSPS
jgi:tRNA (guanine-N7-)-methyltransferase